MTEPLILKHLNESFSPDQERPFHLFPVLVAETGGMCGMCEYEIQLV